MKMYNEERKMYCKKCGKYLSENAEFCSNCGFAVRKMKKEKFLNMNDEKHSKNKKIGMITVTVAVILFIGLGFALFGGRSYKKVVDVYVKSSLSGSEKGIKKIINLFPKEYYRAMLDSYEEEEGVRDEEEMLEELAEVYNQLFEKYEELYGEEWKYSYEIVEEEEYTKKEIREYQESMEEEGINFSAPVKQMKDIVVKIMITAQKGDTDIETEGEIKVIQIGNSWYLIDASMN